ncbi:hypothetical protein M409DRAFT_25604 [Zasmidium cellare ATCC 36951]|uniref:RraA-like protein n=1 Tax=Zasmidium cellare ATCC 36951 TaxID=1080233 RepID=A0A6A6CB48_ZASCE|nr:uncharacterized protein M409DRAFT_25604 [Zasmidium cellare ATCC 36951]KAF2164261.1 hypothetical protein M409DRAFT_25604 [Zasmidium cellare ATCC 36951]
MDNERMFEELRSNYSPCDISDALLTLKSPGAGHLANIHPLPGHTRNSRLVAPVSTVLFVHRNIETLPKPSYIPDKPNLPSDRHWTDVAPPGSVVIMQLWKPHGHPEIVSGLLGDIVGTRYKKRGIKGVVVDGRSRDIQGVNRLGEDGTFQAWTRALTSVGTGMEAKPWAVDVPLRIGQVEVKPGDIIHADEGERVAAVIPQDRLHDVATVLPRLKNADDAVLEDVVSGGDLKKAFGQYLVLSGLDEDAVADFVPSS